MKMKINKQREIISSRYSSPEYKGVFEGPSSKESKFTLAAIRRTRNDNIVCYFEAIDA